MLRITVGKNGEDYTTLQEAINAVPYRTEAEIVVSAGVYTEKIFSDKDSLTIRGEGNAVISWSDGGYEILDRNMKRGTFRSYTAFFSGRSLHLENLTIRNGAGDGHDAGQGIALYLDADDAVLENVRLLGHQDTLFLAPLPDEEREKYGFYGPRHLVPRRRTMSRFQECVIEGTIDFIFGGGDALFEDSEIRSAGPGYVTAPSGKKDWTGFVFSRCRFTSPLQMEGGVYLMRPWRKEGRSAFISCSFGRHISPDAFIPWPGHEDEAHLCTFRLSGCTSDGDIRIEDEWKMDADAAGALIRSFGS